jgi:acylphosphatase
LKSVRAVISGRVQGVWYCRWTEKQATARGLFGWVRNCSDGTVEAVFSGTEADVDAMLEACKTGPQLARVERVDAEACDAPEQRFSTRATA